jgi:hypothetical protein
MPEAPDAINNTNHAIWKIMLSFLSPGAACACTCPRQTDSSTPFICAFIVYKPYIHVHKTLQHKSKFWLNAFLCSACESCVALGQLFVAGQLTLLPKQSFSSHGCVDLRAPSDLLENTAGTS